MSEFDRAVDEAQNARVVGPSEVKLLDQATLAMPEHFVFIPMPAAGKLLHAMGNAADPNLVGALFPGGRENWMIVVQFEHAGFIRDDDARDWDIDQLLRGVRNSTERDNDERRRLGFPELKISGWAERPHYDSSTHRLSWAIEVHEAGAGSGADPVVNYNTYALGGDGFFKLNLVTSAHDLPTQKPIADMLLGDLTFDDGKKYAQFNAGSDPVAEFGVAALIAGVAAKKLGVGALLFAFFLKFLNEILGAAALVAVVVAIMVYRQRMVKTKPVAEEFPHTQLLAPLDAMSTIRLEPAAQSGTPQSGATVSPARGGAGT